MYEPTFWRDHVTEFNDRFREQNNADGTITHVPIEGEIIQEGTPQNAANFNNIEMGIFAASEIAAELTRIALLGGNGAGSAYPGMGGNPENATSVIYQQIEIPAIGWEAGEIGFCVDIPIEGVTEDMIPFVSIPRTATQNASGYEWNSVDTFDGFMRFYAESAPETPLTAYATLVSPFAISSGSSVLKAASKEDVDEVIRGIFG